MLAEQSGPALQGGLSGISGPALQGGLSGISGPALQGGLYEISGSVLRGAIAGRNRASLFRGAARRNRPFQRRMRTGQKDNSEGHKNKKTVEAVVPEQHHEKSGENKTCCLFPALQEVFRVTVQKIQKHSEKQEKCREQAVLGGAEDIHDDRREKPEEKKADHPYAPRHIEFSQHLQNQRENCRDDEHLQENIDGNARIPGARELMEESNRAAEKQDVQQRMVRGKRPRQNFI